jgi:hypothetical protein
LADYAKDKKSFETYIARPAGVMAKDSGAVISAIMSLVPSIKVDKLAATLLDTAVNGGQKQTMENGDLVCRGKELLA